MPKGKCKFDQSLLKNDKYKQWLQPANGDLYKAYCILCKTSFSTEYGCESSIKSQKKAFIALMKKIIEKIQQRSPLKYLIVHSAARLSPSNMADQQKRCLSCFSLLVNRLHKDKYLSGLICLTHHISTGGCGERGM